MDDETCSVINGINPDCYQCQGSGFRPDILEMVHFEFNNLTTEQANECENFRTACDRHKCYFL